MMKCQFAATTFAQKKDNSKFKMVKKEDYKGKKKYYKKKKSISPHENHMEYLASCQFKIKPNL